MTTLRSRRRGFTLVEVSIAVFIVVIVSMAGAAYYASARVGEITEWHEANALYIGEREVEAWQAVGYTGLAGFVAAQVSPNFLPYGYRQGQADPQWNQTTRSKAITLDGFPYRVKAMLLHNQSTGNPANDFFWRDVHTTGTGSINVNYRRVRVHVQWGVFTGNDAATNELILETRLAR